MTEMTTQMESTMADVSHVSGIVSAPVKSRDIPILIAAGLIAVGLCVVIAIYSNPANIAPSDPVPVSFFP
jgi:hypothetical protein